MDVTRLLNEHAKLRSAGTDLLVLVATDEPCDFAELARRRWNLARMVHLHLAYEERHLFYRLQSDPRAEVRAAGARAKCGVEQLHRSYHAHVERWTTDEIRRCWPRFQASVKTMVGRMIAKIDREEVDLFPLIANDATTESRWQIGMRNWAGDGVALQPLINGAARPGHASSQAGTGNRRSSSQP